MQNLPNSQGKVNRLWGMVPVYIKQRQMFTDRIFWQYTSTLPIKLKHVYSQSCKEETCLPIVKNIYNICKSKRNSRTLAN